MMFKKFISMTTAVLLMASSISILAAPSASAATITDATATSTAAIGTSGTNATAITISATLVTSGVADTFFLNLPMGWSFATTPNISTNLSGYVVQAIGTGFVVLAGASPFASSTEVSITFGSNALNVGSNRIFSFQFVESIPGSSAIVVDTGTATLAGGGSAPTPTAAEIAAAAAQAAEAASNAGRMIREGKLIEAKKSLSTQLKGGVAGTKEEFIAAKINVTTDASLARLNAEVLKLAVADRSDFDKIKALAAAIEFDETFFNESSRPNTSMYAAQGVAVSERTLAAINAKILELPAEKRLDVVAIQEIAKNENFIDRIANPLTRSLISASSLVSRGLIPADYARKQTVIRNLEGYEEASLNTVAKIEAAIKEEMLKADARDLRYKAIVAKIAARSSK
jgi:hypothetical protein